MKVTFSIVPFERNFSVHSRQFGKALEAIRDMGYSGIDGPVDWKRLSEKETWTVIRKLLEDYNLEFSCILGPIDLKLNNPVASIRETSIKITKALVDISAILGCENVLIGCAKLPYGVPVEKAWRPTVKAIREVADYAVGKSVNLVYEYWNRFETNFINNADDTVKLIEDVGSEGLYGVLDTFHMNIEEKSFEEPVKKMGRKLKYVHLSESNRLALGMGHIDFANFLKALKNIAYDGPLCVEIFYYRDRDWPKDPFSTAVKYASESMKFLRSLAI